MIERAVKDEKINAKSESKVTRTIVHSFPRPLFNSKE